MFTNECTFQNTRIIIQLLVATYVLALLPGCGTLYKLEIDASNPQQSEVRGSYVLIPSDADTGVDSVEFERYSNQIERALSSRDLRRLPLTRIAEADMAIVVNYWAGDPETVAYTETVPMFRTTNSPGSEEGTRQSGGNNRSGQAASAPSGVVDPPAKTVLLGTSTTTFPRTVYTRELRLKAITFNIDGTDVLSIRQTGRLWSIVVSTIGSSPDLDEVMPVMVAAVEPYVGTHSEEPIRTKMNGIDKRIKTIRGDD